MHRKTEAAKQLAIKDEFTQLSNRRALTKALKRHYSLAVSTGVEKSFHQGNFDKINHRKGQH